MKRIFTLSLFIAVWLFFHTTIKAQSLAGEDSSSGPHRNIISINPVFAGAGMYNMSYERSLAKQFSLNVTASYEFKNRHPASYSQTRFFFAQLQPRFYPFGKSPSGFFVGAFFFYGHSSYLTYPLYWGNIEGPVDATLYFPPEGGTVSSISLGPLAGYKFMIIKRIAIDLFLECGPNYCLRNTHGYDMSPLTDDFMIMPSINLGYAFK